MENAASGHPSLAKSITYFEDQSTTRSFKDILSIPSTHWQGLREEVPSFGFTPSAYWLKFTLCAPEAVKEGAVLEITYPLLDDIHVLGVVDQSIIFDMHSGDALPFSARPTKHRNFVFFLPDFSQGELSLYIRVQTKSAMQIPLQLTTKEEFFRHNQLATVLQGLYFGIILAMILYNAFLYLALRERPYLFYVLFTTGYLSFQGIFQGFFQQYFFDSVWLNDHSLLISGFLSIMLANEFAVSFLSLPTKHFLVSHVLRCIGSLSGLAAIFASIFPYEIMVKMMLVLAIPSSLVILYASCSLWWSGHLPARIFTVAWSTLLISFVLASFNKIGLLPRKFWTENILQIGGLMEVILLSIALAERVNEEKRQRILAERRLSTALEEQVEERTKELHKALEQLETANVVLSQISHTDSLTQIANRRSFDIQLAVEYKTAAREAYPLTLIMADIDHFKNVNDDYGHPTGDKILQTVAKVLAAHASRPGDSVYRYGGEEFAILLANTNLAGARIVAEKMRKAIEMTPTLIEGRSFFVTISAGLYVYDRKDASCRITSHEELIHQADIRLYKAKNKGRNQLEAPGDSSSQP